MDVDAVMIAGPRVSLRDFRPDDLEAVAAYASDPAVTAYLVWRPHASRQDTENWLKATVEQAATDPRRHFELAVVENRSGALIGGARVTVRNRDHRVGDLGYVLRRSVWGQGFGTEVARLLVQLGFSRLALHRIEATCDPDNTASRRVLENVGMQREGYARENFWVRGTWRDSLLFAILEQEWP